LFKKYAALVPCKFALSPSLFLEGWGEVTTPPQHNTKVQTSQQAGNGALTK
jgi:hypothetical protein